MKELSYETNQNDLIYYFKGNTVTKWFDDSNDVTNVLKKYI